MPQGKEESDFITVWVESYDDEAFLHALNKKIEWKTSANAHAAFRPDVFHVQPSAKATTVQAKKFKQNLEQTMNVLRESFEGAMHQPIGDLHVDEIEVALEVGAEGKVGILGTGASVSGKSSITVRFKRNPHT